MIGCGIVPLMMCTRLTPFSMASTQAVTFGIMPPEIVPSAIRFIACSVESTANSEAGSSGSLRTPSMSVRKISFSALSAVATAAAAVSALML